MDGAAPAGVPPQQASGEVSQAGVDQASKQGGGTAQRPTAEADRPDGADQRWVAGAAHSAGTPMEVEQAVRPGGADAGHAGRDAAAVAAAGDEEACAGEAAHQYPLTSLLLLAMLAGQQTQRDDT